MTSTATYEIETLNRADGSVDGHRAGCADIARIAKKERIDRSGSWTVTSKLQAWADYNADFIGECYDHETCDEAHGQCANAYTINWLPCADHVPATAEDTTEKESTMSKKTETTETKAASIPNTRTYDTSSKALRIKALGVDCTIPYCRATPDESCRSAKGLEVEPHTRRVQKALAMEKAAAKKAAKAAADPKAAAKAAAKPAAPKGKKASTKANATPQESRQEEPTEAVEPRLYDVCKPCLTRHHKSCKGTPEAPCGCESKVHAA